MVGLIGADVEALERLATDFDNGAQELRDLSARLAGSIEAARDWQGPDADRCKEEWGSFAQERMTGSVTRWPRPAGCSRRTRRSRSGRAAGGVGGRRARSPAVPRRRRQLRNLAMKPLRPSSRPRHSSSSWRCCGSTLGELLSSVRVAEALKVFMQGSRTVASSAPGSRRSEGLAGKAFLPLTAISGVARTSSPVAATRVGAAWATRGFGLAGAAGGGDAAARGRSCPAPVTAHRRGGRRGGVRAVERGQRRRRQLGRHPRHRGARPHARRRPRRARLGRRPAGLGSAIGWARGLLGGGPRLAGAGA